MDMQKIYEQIAELHGITPEEVERDMKEAVDAAYENMPAGTNRVPTVEEFVCAAAQKPPLYGN